MLTAPNLISQLLPTHRSQGLLTPNLLRKKSTPLRKPAFKAIMNSVRYVTVDGYLVEDKKIMEEVIKQFVKRLKIGNIQNPILSKILTKEMPEYFPYGGNQSVKFLKLNMLGKNLNIIIGEPARKLKHIWEQSGVKLETKKAQASEVVKSIIYGPSHKQIALHATSETIKGKTKYIIENLHTTV